MGLVKESQNSCPCQVSNYGYLSCPPHSLVTKPTAQFRLLCRVKDNTISSMTQRGME